MYILIYTSSTTTYTRVYIHNYYIIIVYGTHIYNVNKKFI